MNTLDAAKSGTFAIGGDLVINRLGFGAMRLTGQGIWGPPKDRAGALETVRRLPELGVNFIDTADSYGPGVSEDLIREALYPYGGVNVATKGGLTRPGPDQWRPYGDPNYLVRQAEGSRRRLGVEIIDLWQLHRIDPSVSRDAQFAAVAGLIERGIVRHAGLSQVGVAEIEAGRRFFPVATVQNLYNLADRSSEDVVDYCEREGIGFIPWFPLAAGRLVGPGSHLDSIAKAHGATPGQVALAWLLRCSPVILPIPGTAQVTHLEENVGAAALTLSDAEFATLNEAESG